MITYPKLQLSLKNSLNFAKLLTPSLEIVKHLSNTLFDSFLWSNMQKLIAHVERKVILRHKGVIDYIFFFNKIWIFFQM